MQLKIKSIPFMQEGGAMPAQQGGGEQEMMMQLLQMAAQAVQSQDCQTALQVCQAFVQLAQGGQAGQPMEEEAPAEPQGEPVYRYGGTLYKRI